MAFRKWRSTGRTYTCGWAGLLALSGYLIAGSAIAGTGLIVDMVIPSAAIRLFAIVRTIDTVSRG